MEKLLPQSIEAECGVLGSIIIDPEAIVQVADFLTALDFYRDAHRTLYETIMYLYERHEPADFITICDELERRGKLEDIGGASYITSLVNRVPTSGNVEYYGHIVERTGTLRRLIHAAGQMAAIAYEEGEVDTTLDRAEQLVYSIRRAGTTHKVQSAASLYLDYCEQLAKTPRGSVVGIPSGFRAIDAMTGGWQKSDLIILAGRPSMGKSSMMMALARNAAMQHGYGVLVFSLEMSSQQLMQRLVAMETHIDLQRLRINNLSDYERRAVQAVGKPIAEAPLWIDDTPGLTITAMRSKIRRVMSEFAVDLIILDYLGKMKGVYEDGKRIHDRVQEVSDIARGLKDVAREFNLPVIALSQLNRAVESRQVKVPQLSDLRDSGEIEQEADIVTFIHRDDYYAGYYPDGKSKSERPKTADIVFAKHRNGPVGEALLGFEASETRFYTCDEHGREVKV